MSKQNIERIAVIGSGSMGHQIAMLCALGGFQTSIHDVEDQALEQAESKLADIMADWVRKNKVTEEKVAEAFTGLAFTTDLREAAADADFVIEAVVEKLDVKKDVFAKLDGIAPKHAILATNSSTIVSSLIASATSRPDQVCNMHFFFPPLVMDCVEVVMSDETSEATAQTAIKVCDAINRTGILLRKEISGFVANRILGAITKEALHLYEEGIADFKDIDWVVEKALGHPLGPFRLMDLSGLDVHYDVMTQQYNETGDPKAKPSAIVAKKVEKGELGRKTGRGWYNYKTTKV